MTGKPPLLTLLKSMSPNSPLMLNTDIGKGVTINFDQLSDDIDILALIKKHQSILRFPEKLMLLMIFVERTCSKRGKKPNQACISWTDDGSALIIRDHKELVEVLIPRVFHSKLTFASFTRKLYRWGFRQKDIKYSEYKTGDSSLSGGVKVFFHELFQRDNKKSLTQMKCMSTECTTSFSWTSSGRDEPFPASTGTKSAPTLTSLNQTILNGPCDRRIPLHPETDLYRDVFSRYSIRFHGIGVEVRQPPLVPSVLLSQGTRQMETPFIAAAESSLLYTVLAMEWKQKQDRILAQTLDCLNALADDKKRLTAHHKKDCEK